MSPDELEIERIAAILSVEASDLRRWNGETGAFYYDGVPEWAASDFPAFAADDCADGLEHRTVYTFGDPASYPRVDADFEGWTFVRSYNASVERECPWCGPGTGDEHRRAECKLCEGDGLIYEGDGFSEAVFSRPRCDDSCEQCGESMAAPDDDLCAACRERADDMVVGDDD